MKSRLWGILISALLLVACSGMPTVPVKPYYTQDVLVVGKDWDKYWADMAWPHKVGMPPDPGGCIRYQGIIDSNGRVFDGKLLAVSGPQGLADWANNFFAVQQFKPTPTNSNRTPVKALFDLSFFNHAPDDHKPRGTVVPPTADQAADMQQCSADMDRQMGITSAPAAATASHPR